MKNNGLKSGRKTLKDKIWGKTLQARETAILFYQTLREFYKKNQVRNFNYLINVCILVPF